MCVYAKHQRRNKLTNECPGATNSNRTSRLLFPNAHEIHFSDVFSPWQQTGKIKLWSQMFFLCFYLQRDSHFTAEAIIPLPGGPEVAASWLTAHWKQIERANNSWRVIASTRSLFLLLAEPLYTPASGCWVCWCVSQVVCRLIFIVFWSATEPLLHLPAMFGLQMVRLPALRRLCARLRFQF